ncbi:hypothetical protein ACIQH5_11190 [Paenarthrobacter sp. NPDC091711]|uniref:hypothetical protein n=1 Tax=Paenarthrobacter sp. NPDC091711 TaxID=3364385 RepID=UPI0037FBAFD4
MSIRKASGVRTRLGQWVFGLAIILFVGSLALLIALPSKGPATGAPPEAPPVASSSTPSVSAAAPRPSAKPSGTTKASAVSPVPGAADFRAVASTAAEAIYTWDTRTSSYSEVYGRVRDLWVLLPDGSNPWTVLVQELEATGVNAGSFVTLAGQGAFREANSESLMCDEQLVKVRERPAPWPGLHVCTVRLHVQDHTSASTNSYSAPLSVMVNCPPAPTAPADSCVMVAFYASSDRIVY